jgi:putative FmdB family regulatory protein
MPIFEYRCGSCGNEFEQLVLSSSPPPRCPACDSAELEKLMSSSMVSSKGTRDRNLAGAKKHVGKIRHEKEYEEHKKMHDHHD